MFQNKFTEAKALYDLMIANGKNAQGVKYGLTANYSANFRVTSENNEETIFSIQYSYGDGSNSNGNYDNSLNYPHSPTTPGAGCCGFFSHRKIWLTPFKRGLPAYRYQIPMTILMLPVMRQLIHPNLLHRLLVILIPD